MLFACLATVLCALFTASASAAPDESSTRAHFFMPAIEVGPVWSSDPRIDVGVLFRTSLEYRFRRLRAPFLRASYDATTAGFHTKESQGPSLSANAGFHDLLLGGGLRFGPDVLQFVGSIHGGLQIREIPELRRAGSQLSVEHRTGFAPIAAGAVAAEWYVFRGVAVTGELSFRVPFTPEPSFGGAFTVGVTTSF